MYGIGVKVVVVPTLVLWRRLSLVDRVGHVGHAEVFTAVRIDRAMVVAGYAILDITAGPPCSSKRTWQFAQFSVAAISLLPEPAPPFPEILDRIVRRERLGLTGHADLETHAMRGQLDRRRPRSES